MVKCWCEKNYKRIFIVTIIYKKSIPAPIRTNIPSVEKRTVSVPTPAFGRASPPGVGDVATIDSDVGVDVGLSPVVGVSVIVGVGVSAPPRGGSDGVGVGLPVPELLGTGVGVFVGVNVVEGFAVGLIDCVTTPVGVPVAGPVGVVVVGVRVGVGEEMPSPIHIWILLMSLHEEPDPTLLHTT